MGRSSHSRGSRRVCAGGSHGCCGCDQRRHDPSRPLLSAALAHATRQPWLASGFFNGLLGEPVEPACGTSEALPRYRDLPGWSGYRCMRRELVPAVWASCLPRSAYSHTAGAGCPGRQLCCPADDALSLKVTLQGATTHVRCQGTKVWAARMRWRLQSVLDGSSHLDHETTDSLRFGSTSWSRMVSRMGIPQETAFLSLMSTGASRRAQVLQSQLCSTTTGRWFSCSLKVTRLVLESGRLRPTATVMA
jgi:hypothetical protein